MFNDDDFFKGLFAYALGFFIVLPLATWKLIDIIVWIVKHVGVSIH
jgi:hypothetical protein